VSFWGFRNFDSCLRILYTILLPVELFIRNLLDSTITVVYEKYRSTYYSTAYSTGSTIQNTETSEYCSNSTTSRTESITSSYLVPGTWYLVLVLRELVKAPGASRQSQIVHFQPCDEDENGSRELKSSVVSEYCEWTTRFSNMKHAGHRSTRSSCHDESSVIHTQQYITRVRGKFTTCSVTHYRSNDVADKNDGFAC
jgi:hypothetical protein